MKRSCLFQTAIGLCVVICASYCSFCLYHYPLSLLQTVACRHVAWRRDVFSLYLSYKHCTEMCSSPNEIVGVGKVPVGRLSPPAQTFMIPEFVMECFGTGFHSYDERQCCETFGSNFPNNFGEGRPVICPTPFEVDFCVWPPSFIDPISY
jgi:hypothetical protein